MGYRVRVFIDFWNFQLQWNERTSKAACDWTRLPRVLLQQAQSALKTAGSDVALELEETRVYASYNPANPTDGSLRRWLDTFLDRQPSFRVFAKERRAQTRPIRCPLCGQEVADCPGCGRPLSRSVEKGVDTAIVTDLLSLAWEGAYDVAILVSCDSDLVPGVERLQEKGLKVINATWKGRGHHLAKTCWASFDIDGTIHELKR